MSPVFQGQPMSRPLELGQQLRHNTQKYRNTVKEDNSQRHRGSRHVCLTSGTQTRLLLGRGGFESRKKINQINQSAWGEGALK